LKVVYLQEAKLRKPRSSSVGAADFLQQQPQTASPVWASALHSLYRQRLYYTARATRMAWVVLEMLGWSGHYENRHA
jgi:hypothetical protein